MLFERSAGTDGAAEQMQDVPVLRIKTIVAADVPGFGVPVVGTTDDLANEVVGGDTFSFRRIERGTARVREDVTEEVGNAAEQLFGTRELFAAQVRATIKSKGLSEPSTFEMMLARAATFLFKDRIINYAAGQNNGGVTAGEAQRMIVEIIEHAMQTRGKWLADMLTKNNLWVAPQDTNDQHIT